MAVDPDSVRNWEAGRTSMDIRYYPRLLAFLGYNPVPLARSLGESIRCERMTRGLSRRRLALVAGVDGATVKRIEEDASGVSSGCRSTVHAVRGIAATHVGPLPIAVPLEQPLRVLPQENWRITKRASSSTDTTQLAPDATRRA